MLQYMVLGELDRFMQKNETRLPTYPYTKIHSIWIKELNISHETIKVLAENIGSEISDVPRSNIFAYISPRASEIKEKNKQMRLHLIKKLLHG